MHVKNGDEMNIKKYVFEYVKSLSIVKFDDSIKYFGNLCECVKDRELSEKEKERFNSIIKQGLETGFTSAIAEYFLNKYEDNVIEYVYREIVSKDDYEYADTYRISDGSALENVLYDIYRASGCCGSFDSGVKYEGKYYKVGFNYGH